MLLAPLWVAGCNDAGSSSLALRYPPYLGVACPGPNSLACDRVGLAVWLEQPATSVTAAVAGQRVRLRIPPDFEPTGYLGPRGAYWEGFLQPAGLKSSFRVRPVGGGERWYGSPPVRASARITAHYGEREAASIELRVPLHPGWG